MPPPPTPPRSDDAGSPAARPGEPASRRSLLLRLFEATVSAAHPRLCLPAHLPDPPDGRVVVLAAGKAAASMAAVAERFYRTRHGLDARRLGGLAVTRHGYGQAAGLIKVVEAGHPVPDEAGLSATLRTIELADAAGPDDLVLVLLSGGGSANWVAPCSDLPLAEKQEITRALLRAGSNIHAFNAVRKHLSRIKGGRLARHAAPARLVTLAISDVPGDDPAVIASGPTVPDPTTQDEACAILSRLGLGLSAKAAGVLSDPANETPKPGDPVFDGAEFRLVMRPADAVAAATRMAQGAGYEPVLLGTDLEGEAREVAKEHARLACDLARAGRQAAILSGGELTVTVRGRGRGGPNQEYALALAIALNGQAGIAALAADTDGTDGGGGAATDPAGAVADEATLERARHLGLDPAASLADNDSTNFFERLGDLVTPGPTRTNVNDCRIILVG